MVNKTMTAFWNEKGQIIPNRLYTFLAENGFGKYFPDGTTVKNANPIIVKVNKNLVSEVNVGYLLEFVRSYIERYFENGGDSGAVLDSLHKSTSLFGEKNLKLLKTLELDFITDTRRSGYFFFKNGIVEVKADGFSLLNYSDINGYIWESSIKEHDFKTVDFETLKQNCDYLNFVRDLSKVPNAEHTEKRFASLQSFIGYLLHKYKDGTQNQAVILMDVFVDGKPNGGSGKSLLINSIGKLRKLAVIDGKSYDQKEWFSLSSVALDTEIILFDDVKANFDFEQIFALLSSGMFLRRKHKDNIHIPHERSPKISLTTNYAINGDSSSHERRKIEFEVSSTYSATNTPRDKFGRNFFDEWDDNDWLMFYNTMFYFLSFYLTNGLVRSEPINIKTTKFVNVTNEEFAEFAAHQLRLDHRFDKKDLFGAFVFEYPEYRNKLTQREFTTWLREWAKFRDCDIAEPRSDSTRYVIFSEKSTS